MMAKTLRMNKGDRQMATGLKWNKMIDVGMRNEAKTVPTTSRVSPSLASRRVILDRVGGGGQTVASSKRLCSSRDDRPSVLKFDILTGVRRDGLIFFEA